MKFLRSFWYPLLCLALSSLIVLARSLQWFPPPKIPIAVIAVPLSFMLGMGIQRSSLHATLRNIRLPLSIIVWIFAIFPLLSMVGLSIGGWLLPSLRQEEVRHALLAISVIPTTISSGVLMTANARGDPAISMVTALMANLIGTLLSPLLLTLLLAANSDLWSIDLLRTSGKILLLIVGPFLLGQLLQPQKLRKSPRAQQTVRMICNILVLINISISTAQIGDMTSLLKLSGTLLFLLIWYPIMIGITVLVSRGISLSRNAEISLVIMGNQKTLSFGLVILTLYFESQPQIVGHLIFVLILFNVWQFILTGVAQSLYAKSAAA